MYVTAPGVVETGDIAEDVETALSIARSLYTGYFEDLLKDEKTYRAAFYSQRDEMRQLLGAVIDYIRSAQTLIAAYEKQQEQQEAS